MLTKRQVPGCLCTLFDPSARTQAFSSSLGLPVGLERGEIETEL